MKSKPNIYSAPLVGRNVYSYRNIFPDSGSQDMLTGTEVIPISWTTWPFVIVSYPTPLSSEVICNLQGSY